MTVARNAARLLSQATPATPLILAAAIIGAGLIHLAVASHVRGAAPPIEQIRSIRVAPASVEGARLVAAPTTGSPPSSVVPVVRFRFGFLEFEDDPDASAE